MRDANVTSSEEQHLDTLAASRTHTEADITGARVPPTPALEDAVRPVATQTYTRVHLTPRRLHVVTTYTRIW